jgi:hypothetical protein
MTTVPLHRQVLVLTDEVGIRNLFYLMRKLAGEDETDGSLRAMVAIAERGEYDAIILDMRRPNQKPGNEPREIGSVQSSRTDRTLTITAEVYGQETLSVMERYLLSGLPGALTWLVGRHYAFQQHVLAL